MITAVRYTVRNCLFDTDAYTYTYAYIDTANVKTITKRWGLLPVTKGGHRIGLVLDCAIEDDLRLRHVQVRPNSNQMRSLLLHVVLID